MRYLLAFCLFATFGFSSDLEESLKKIPDSERPIIYMEAADQQMAKFKRDTQALISIREADTPDVEKNNKYKKQLQATLEAFEHFRSALAELASIDSNEPSEHRANYSYVFYETTKWFVDFSDQQVMPQGWNSIIKTYRLEKKNVTQSSLE